jgi:hypothetical protein
MLGRGGVGRRRRARENERSGLGETVGCRM